MRGKKCNNCIHDDNCTYEGNKSETYFTNPLNQEVPFKNPYGQCPDYEPVMNFERDKLEELELWEEING